MIMRNHCVAVAFLAFAVAASLLISPVSAVDTDGDELLDLIDVPGFNPSASGNFEFNRRGIQDLDGANLLTKLRGLSLDNNQITNIENSDFTGLTHLQSLSLVSNLIASIESGAFEGLANLQSLYLDENQITSIESGAFEGLTNLQWLELNSSQLTSLESTAFQGLTNLRFLGLDKNHITSLEGGALHGLTNLQRVDLNDNQITSIEGGAFERLSNLRNLGLAGNQIKSIESGDFTGLTNLNYLRLDGNQITSIESRDFIELTNLKGLILALNQIMSIENGAFQGMTSLQGLNVALNQITNVASGDFSGLTNLEMLLLNDNQITSIESGAFEGLTNLQTLDLGVNQITELNLTGATFEKLMQCAPSTFVPGFCVDSDEITRLLLDNATLSRGSFDAIVDETTSISDVSLVGLTFSDENPSDLSSVLGIATLDSLTVDQDLFDLYAAEFNAFAAKEGNTLSVVPGLCDANQNGTCDVADIDAMTQNVIAGDNTADERDMLIHRAMPHGFGTWFGDANLDGEFNSNDLVAVLAAGEYEDGIESNSGWTEGDFDGDGEFTSGDLILALADGGYEAGPRAAAVPEPSAFWMLALAFGAPLASRKPVRRSI